MRSAIPRLRALPAAAPSAERDREQPVSPKRLIA